MENDVQMNGNKYGKDLKKANRVGDLLLKFFIYIIGFGGAGLIIGMVSVNIIFGILNEGEVIIAELYSPYRFM